MSVFRDYEGALHSRTQGGGKALTEVYWLKTEEETGQGHTKPLTVSEVAHADVIHTQLTKVSHDANSATEGQ